MLYALLLSMQSRDAYFSLVSARIYLQFIALFGEQLLASDRRASRKLRKLNKLVETNLGQLEDQEVSPEEIASLASVREQLLASKLDENTQKVLLELANLMQRRIIIPETVEVNASPEDAKSPVATPEKTQASKSSTQSVPVAPSASAQVREPSRNVSAISVSVNFENARKVKQTLLDVAQFLMEIAPQEPLSYTLRRFAIWQPIDSLPEVGTDGRTALYQVPKEKTESYELAIKAIDRGSLNLDLLAQIEKSLTGSPFWIYGHYLAAKCAEQNGMPSVASAILQNTASFLARHEGLDTLYFAGGEPYVPEVVVPWLAKAPAKAGGNVLSPDEEQVSGSTSPSSLSAISHAMSGSNERRVQVLDQLRAVELMIQQEQVSLASAFLMDVSFRIESLPLKEWEPSVFDKIERLKKECNV